MVTRDITVAVRADHEHCGRRRRSEDVAKQLQRRGVGPLQVVEHKDERRLRGRGAQDVGDRFEEHEAIALGVASRDRDLGASRQRGHDARQRRTVPFEATLEEIVGGVLHEV